MINKIDLNLISIFVLAVIVRLLYFPENIYFGYDQARDAFNALEILSGDLKLIGPSTSFNGLFHGVLYYYILAPLYFIGSHSPEFVSFVMRVLNASGVFIIFFLSKTLFNRSVGIIAAFLYAISFEQTQFAIYIGNPSLGSLSVMLMYFGLALVIFKNKSIGLPISVLGLGTSIQFQFALTYLMVPYLAILLIYYKRFIKLPKFIYLITIIVFATSLSTFIFAEFKYDFRTIRSLLELSRFNPEKTLSTILNTYLFTASQMFRFNLGGGVIEPRILIIITCGVITTLLVKYKLYRTRICFLLIWFFSIASTIFIHGGTEDLVNNILLYYPNVGVSNSLLIITGFVLYLLISRKKIFLILLLLIAVLNFNLINHYNPKGTIQEINVQQGMLLSDMKKVIDYTYQDGQNFAVKAVTMPFYINTTWSYLYEWYGYGKYGYLPVWDGKNAIGYPGNLLVKEKQEDLPKKRYLIIEPTRGIGQGLIDEYIKEENYFTNITDQKNIGEFVVQKREKY